MAEHEKKKNPDEILHATSNIKRLPLWLLIIYIALPVWGIYYFVNNAGMSMSMPTMVQPAPQMGLAIAREQGCLACHGPEGKGGVDNPGSPDKTVPGWNSDDLAANNMYYPIILKQEIEHAAIRSFFDSPSDLGAQEYMSFKMQPWIGRLTGEQIKMVMAYIYSINPALQKQMLAILNNEEPPAKFNDVSGDVNPAYWKDDKAPAIMTNGEHLATPAVRQIPGGTNYPEQYSQYFQQQSASTPPQYIADIKEFLNIAGVSKAAGK
jgi:mono/diheme cytochrome c family protein